MVKGAEARKMLSRAVRVGFWDKPEAMELQDELMRTARKLIEEGYRECIRSGKPITECYREVAKEANLSKAYRGIWGSPGA